MSNRISDEEYRMLIAHLRAINSGDKYRATERMTYIDRINRNSARSARRVEEKLRQEEERLIIARKLSEQEKEYQEIIKAQEIMDQVDEERKRYA